MARNDTWLNQVSTLVDPYKVERYDEFAPDNLLNVGSFEGTTPLGSREPNSVPQLPMYGPVSDELPEFTPPARPEPEPAPVGQTVTSYQEEIAKAAPKMFSSHFTQDEWDAAKARQKAANEDVAKFGETAQSRLVSAAPDWYKAGKPPASHGGWADAANMLGGALAAGPAQALKDPLRPSDLKAQDAKKVALAGGLSTLLSNLFTHGQTDYKAQQDAALKEAQMMKTVPGGKSASQIKREGADKTIEQMQRDAMQDSLTGHRKFEEDQKTAELNPDDPQAVAWREAVIAGGVPPEQVAGLGRKALQGIAAANNITLSATHTAGQKTADANEAERQIILRQKIEQDAKLDDELRKEKQRRGESAIPEVDWVNNTPPPPKAVEDVRELYKTKKGFIDRLDRMRALQPRIEEIARKYAADHGYPGDVGKALAALGPIMKWTETFGPEAHDLVNEASVLQRSIQNFIRSESYSNLGVMQKWEDLMTRVQVPTAGSATALLRGEAAWKALRDDVERMWVDGVAAANGRVHAPGQKAAETGASTPEERKAERPGPTLPPKQVYNPRARQVETVADGASEPVPTDTTGGLAPQAPVPKVPGATPAPAPTPTAPKLEAGQKMYKITKKDGTTKDKAMTPEDAKLLGTHTDVITSVVEM